MKKILPVLLVALALALPGCSGGGGANNCQFSGLIANGTYLVIHTNPTSGVVTTIGNRTASPSGILTVSTTFNCGQLDVIQLTDSNLTLSASPSSVDLTNPPGTVTITGQSFDATYGMPRVEYFDSNGWLVASTYASSVSGGGTSLQCSVPSLAQVFSGTYTIRVTNKTYQGQYVHRVGTATMTTYGRDRLDSDSDGWYDDQDCDPYNPYYTNNCNSGTCGGSGNVPFELCDPL